MPTRSRSTSRDRHEDLRKEGPRSRERERDRKHRDRSTSPYDRHRNKDKERDRGYEKSSRREKERGRQSSSDEDEGVDLRDMGVKEIGEEDYFLKSSEFKAWLKEEKGKYLDEMSSESAHKYFRKFVRRWNDGLLKPHHYHPPPPTSASENTGYKWSFAGRSESSLKSIREDVSRSTHSSIKPETNPGSITSYTTPGPIIGPSTSTSSSRVTMGPSIPSISDRQYSKELSQDARKSERKSHLRDMYNRADELVPRNSGKEGKLEERRALNNENKKFRDKDLSAGLEVDEGILMGDEQGSFAAALRAREQAESRRKDRKEFAMQDRRSGDSERLMERKAKESATMDMFKALAKERFG